MIDEIREPLERICREVEGALAATVMGFDGVPVDTYRHVEDSEADISALLVEYSTLLEQVKSSAQMFAAGHLQELAIRAEHVTALIRPLNDELFLALCVDSTAYLGKGRYLLRAYAPRLAELLT